MKYYIMVCIRNFLKIFYVIPIRKNRIIFTSYSGRQFSCNPKYIYNYMLEANKMNVEYIWAFNNPSDFDLEESTIKVRYKSLMYVYYTLTAKVIIENVESWSILPIRKGQIVVNTWHGGGAYKKVGIDRKDARSFNDLNVAYKNQRVNLYISSSDAFSEMTLRQSFQYTGEIISSGMPRNDILINHSLSIRDEIKEKIGIKNKKVLIIAPTFRKHSQHDMARLDFNRMIDALKSRFAGEWVVLYRSHYYESIDFDASNMQIIDVSNYPDMQELLLISDVLLTDYSSSIWDFSLTNKPVFLYSTDLEVYQSQEREFYTPVTSWPFSYAGTFNALLDNILAFNEAKYVEEVANHHDNLGSYEQGNASMVVGNYIFNRLNLGGTSDE